MPAALNFTISQQKQIKAIFDEMRSKMNAPGEAAALLEMDKAAYMQALFAKTNATIRALLTTDQQTVFDQIQREC